jgi:integrase/recombinase XerD
VSFAGLGGVASGRPLLPLQFASLERLDEDVARVVERGREVEGLSVKTLAWWEGAYRSFRASLKACETERLFLGGHVADQLRALEAWVARLRERGARHGGINVYWRGLKSLVGRIAAERGAVNPLALVRTPRAAPPQPRCLPRKAAEAVVVFVRNYPWLSRLVAQRNLAVVGLMLLAGLRRSEVLRLNVEDVSLESATIRILRAKGRHGGKDRMAYVSPQLQEILAAYVAERRRARRASPALLTRARRDERIGEGTLRRLFHVISTRAGIRVSPHMLRHTYATLLRQAGVPDRLSMDLLGHASLTMLQRYSHVESGEHRAAAERLTLDLEP